MSSTPEFTDNLRAHIMAQPDLILEDPDLMRALTAANERAMGENIVDLRGIAMDRLEARLDRLEDTHRSVIGAAHDNLAGTHQVHRAILRMLDPLDFGTFLRDLDGDVAHILRVDRVRLVLESAQKDDDAAMRGAGEVLSVAEPGFIRSYLTGRPDVAARHVTLRQIHGGDARVHGGDAARLRSEACLLLDLGENRLPGLLVMGSEDADQFNPQQGTDLLAFFAGVFERSMRRWLA
ncbi:DUF484 family protein [Roseovarius tibetensis]|uniref:DUF484 family protein n=1 Tax=Roseovarius tibetensis TaxID=2685897 RepID=UPI003D7FCB2A